MILAEIKVSRRKKDKITRLATDWFITELISVTDSIVAGLLPKRLLKQNNRR